MAYYVEKRGTGEKYIVLSEYKDGFLLASLVDKKLSSVKTEQLVAEYGFDGLIE